MNELEASGLVLRRAVNDRRKLLVEITAQGRRWFKASSAEVMLNPLGVPSTSVNHNWTKRMPRSSTVRST